MNVKSNPISTLLFVVGLVLLGFAGSTYLEATGPNCDGCAPFHPLFVFAPLVAGAALTLGAYALWRR